LLCGERSVRSVANLTRRDAEDFLRVAPEAGVRAAVSCYPLDEANRALDDLRHGKLVGAAVLVPR
jgi:propanol-preferring alcohol dehydrogenase